MLDALPVLDAILQRHAAELGKDHLPYRNHAYRVANFHWCLLPGSDEDRYVVSVAAAFHDLGIWTDGTFDYLGPSEAQARAYLQAEGCEDLAPLVVAMIDHHHQVSAMERTADPRVEAFRKADWIDVTLGLRRFGLRADDFKRILARFPRLGFHGRLVQFAWHHGLQHPMNPLPMLRR